MRKETMKPKCFSKTMPMPMRMSKTMLLDRCVGCDDLGLGEASRRLPLNVVRPFRPNAANPFLFLSPYDGDSNWRGEGLRVKEGSLESLWKRIEM